jgi:hypothetical protein
MRSRPGQLRQQRMRGYTEYGGDGNNAAQLALEVGLAVHLQHHLGVLHVLEPRGAAQFPLPVGDGLHLRRYCRAEDRLGLDRQRP